MTRSLISMNDYFIQLVLGQRDGNSESIVQLLIFVVIIVAGVIRSLFAAKQEQNQKQNQKKPVPHSSIQRKPPASAEQIRMQRERVEQFLEGILQPKKRPQQPSRPVPAKPQIAGVVPAPAKTAPVSKVYTNQSNVPVPYREMSASMRQAKTDTILDTNAIKIDTQLEEIPDIQEDQQSLNFHDKPKRPKVPERKSPDLMFAFSDSDDLRKAILYTEILGRPISLRESEALYD